MLETTQNKTKQVISYVHIHIKKIVLIKVLSIWFRISIHGEKFIESIFFQIFHNNISSITKMKFQKL